MKININLDNDFERQLEKLKAKYGEEITKINGFSEEQLDYTDFIDNFVDETNAVADSTIDSSANVSTKDVRTLLDEMSKPHCKLLSFNKIYYEMKKAYGKKVANKWLEDEFSGALYMHDAHSASFFSYCYAYELQNLAEKGLYFLPKTNTQPPNHLTTFMAHLREFICWVSNRSAGACALPGFFIYTYYFWKKDVEQGYYLKDPEYYRRQLFQQFIFEVNQIHGRITQSPYTNLIIMDRNYITELFGDRTYPDGTYVVDYVDEIIEHQKAYMETECAIRKQVFMTFPVYTYALLFQDGKFVDEEFTRWCNKQNLQWYDSNFYIGDTVTNLASCCRMVNQLAKQKDFQSSIGGSLIEIGSVKVSTINLMRIALESKGNKEKFIKILTDRVKLNMMVLDRVRYIIQRNIEKHLLPNYSYHVINLDKQTTTNGLTAMFESIREMGMTSVDEFGAASYTDEGLEFAKLIMDTVNKLQDESGYDYNISLEIIPAESANVKLCKKDNIIYDRNEDFIYSNQWVSLMSKCSIDERVKLSAALDKKAGGGQILHISLEGAQLTEETSWSILNDLASKGVIYFAFNPKLSICQNSHTFFGNTCPICGNPKSDEVSRIVGYLVPTAAYSKERYEEYNNRMWYEID